MKQRFFHIALFVLAAATLACSKNEIDDTPISADGERVSVTATRQRA